VFRPRIAVIVMSFSGGSVPVSLNDDERRVLLRIFDAFFCDLGETGAEELAASIGSWSRQKAVVDFAHRKASECADDIIEAVESKLSFAIDVPDLREALQLLATPMGSFLLTGHAIPVQDMELPMLQNVLAKWFRSIIRPKRDLAKTFRSLLAISIFSVLSEDDHGVRDNINWKAIGYRGCKVQVDNIWEPFVACRVPAPLSGLDLVVDCVLVGSGVGGGIMAAELTEAGFTVALLEVGQLQASKEGFQPDEGRAARQFYQDGMTAQTHNYDINIMAAKAFGGGSAVNWSCSLPPPHHVRQEWARDFGLEWASNSQLSEAIDAVTARLSIHVDSNEENLNPANQILMRGCKRLGYPAEIAAQQGFQHPDEKQGGYCTIGLKQGKRQGMHGSALLDAANTGRLLILDGCQADKVLCDEDGYACGVSGSLATSNGPKNVIIRGQTVVVAGGALQTPLLLKRSGLRNPNIGKHLRLHPAGFLWGRFDQEVRHFEGAPMTTVSRVVENQDGHGYGAKIWVPCMPPATWSSLLPWHGAKEYKHALSSYDHAAPLVCIVRDTTGGTVDLNEEGKLRIKYSVSKLDRKHLQEAFEKAARILVAAGAREVHVLHQGILPLVLQSQPGSIRAQAELESWFQSLRTTGMPVSTVSLGSAHQMGSCRMAASPKLGAAKPSGEMWEVPGLFVADTSTFPTASGVNPMYTCASVAYLVSQHVKRHLEEATQSHHLASSFPCSNTECKHRRGTLSRLLGRRAQKL
jgi:choline dehydrogenase-like flavoprotein